MLYFKTIISYFYHENDGQRKHYVISKHNCICTKSRSLFDICMNILNRIVGYLLTYLAVKLRLRLLSFVCTK